MSFEGLIQIPPVAIEVVMGSSLAVLAIKFMFTVKGFMEPE